MATHKPDYGNWVSTRLIFVPAALALVWAAASFWVPALAVLALLFALCAAYFCYARYRFSTLGGNVQGRIQDLVLQHLEWDGEGQALDIGCGNAPLTVALAAKCPNARVTGIDYWGTSWEYAQGVCERNARLAGVGQRVTFQKGTASALPFADGTFDAAVSNLTFHEVSDTADKRAVLREALRVIRKGGSFCFQDLFLWKRLYGDVDDLVATVKSWGIEQVEFVDTSKSAFIPKGLKLPFMVGTLGILYGRK